MILTVRFATSYYRLHHVSGEKKDWQAFFARIPDDLPRTDVINQIMAEEDNGRQIVFVSARPEDHPGND